MAARFGSDGFGTLHPGKQVVGWGDDEEVDDEGQENEGDCGVEEVAVGDYASVDVEDESGEVGFANDCCNEGGDDVFNKRADDGAEGRPDDDGDREIEDVAAEYEVTKAFDHWKLLS